MTTEIKELVKRFRSNEVAALPEHIRAFVTAAADALEAMAGEVAFVKAQLAGTNKNIAGWLQARDDANLRAAVAEIERDRLKDALEAFVKHFGPLQDNAMLHEDVRNCYRLARKALGDAS